MDTSKTQFSKGRDGWKGEDTIDMGTQVTDYAGRVQNRVLHITTHKSYRGGLVSAASCMLEGNGFTTFAIGGDYSKTVAKLDNRCTENSVRQLHAAVMEQQADALLAEARAFYEAKDAAKALHAKRDADMKAADEARTQADLAEARVPA